MSVELTSITSSIENRQYIWIDFIVTLGILKNTMKKLLKKMWESGD
ncbi:MAG: hypothetical protein IJJ11_05355 [Methanosphaera sp.]|nr:hypothetical protein [Methanosphaera sp.]